MKKLLGLLAVIIAFTLTGCGATKTLTCTKDYNASGLQMHEDVKTTFNGDKVKKMVIAVDATMSDTLTPYADKIKDALTSQYKKYSDNGAPVDIKVDGKEIHVVVTMDLDKMTSKQRSNLNVSNVKGSMTDNKKDFENAGYTCK